MIQLIKALFRCKECINFERQAEQALSDVQEQRAVYHYKTFELEQQIKTLKCENEKLRDELALLHKSLEGKQKKGKK